MILTTERLLLRPWCEADAENLYQLAKDADVAHPAGWPPHTSAEHSLDVIRTVLSKPTVFAVCAKNGLPIGNIHLDFQTPLRLHDGECELGYWLGKAYWGQGLMTEAARALFRTCLPERVFLRYGAAITTAMSEADGYSKSSALSIIIPIWRGTKRFTARI